MNIYTCRQVHPTQASRFQYCERPCNLGRERGSAAPPWRTSRTSCTSCTSSPQRHRRGPPAAAEIVQGGCAGYVAAPGMELGCLFDGVIMSESLRVTWPEWRWGPRWTVKMVRVSACGKYRTILQGLQSEEASDHAKQHTPVSYERCSSYLQKHNLNCCFGQVSGGMHWRWRSSACELHALGMVHQSFSHDQGAAPVACDCW